MGTAQILTIGGQKVAAIDARGGLRVSAQQREEKESA
jgi:hypothetical protein